MKIHLAESKIHEFITWIQNQSKLKEQKAYKLYASFSETLKNMTDLASLLFKSEKDLEKNAILNNNTTVSSLNSVFFTKCFYIDR